MRRFAAATMPMMAYGFALIAPACATAISLLFPSFFAANPFTPFYLAAALAAWYGGLGAGLTSVVAGTLAAGYVSLPPRGHFVFNTPGILHLLLFIAVACAITGLIATAWRRREAPTRRASDRAPEADRWAESEQGERNAVARAADPPVRPANAFDRRDPGGGATPPPPGLNNRGGTPVRVCHSGACPDAGRHHGTRSRTRWG